MSILALIAIGAASCGTESPSVNAPSEPPTNVATVEETEDGGGETVTLRFAAANAENSVYGGIFSRWMEEISEISQGQVEWEAYYGGSLLAAAEILPGLQDGRIDVGHISAGVFPDELPLYQVAGVPFVTDNAIASIEAMSTLYEQNSAFQSEFDAAGVHVTFFSPSGPGAVGLDEPVTTLDDLSGKQLRAYGYASDALNAVGSTPVSIPFTELYESVQRGVVDGFFPLPISAVVDLGLHELTPELTDTSFGVFASGAIAFSDETWESMPENVKAAIVEASSGTTDTADELLSKADVDACDELKNAGGNVSVLPPEEVENWQRAIGNSITEQYVDSVVSQGGSAEEAETMLSEYEELAAAAEEETDHVNGLRKCAGLE